MWPTMKHLTAPMCRSAARRLEIQVSRHWSLANCFRDDQRRQLKTLSNILALRNWREILELEHEGPGPAAPSTDLIRRAVQLWSLSKRRVIAEYLRGSNANIRRAGMPYRTVVQPAIAPARAVEDESGAPGDAVAPLMEYEVMIRTELSLLMTTLAIRAYRLETGRYPENLCVLAPSYLSAVPEDPFTTGARLRYVPTDSGYRLWSVGPDGVNNRGSISIRSNRWGSSIQHGRAKDTGDVVVDTETPLYLRAAGG
jgi:hypothetical protein